MSGLPPPLYWLDPCSEMWGLVVNAVRRHAERLAEEDFDDAVRLVRAAVREAPRVDALLGLGWEATALRQAAVFPWEDAGEPDEPGAVVDERSDFEASDAERWWDRAEDRVMEGERGCRDAFTGGAP